MLYKSDEAVVNRLVKEWKKYPLIIGVDFDDTVYDSHQLGQDFTEVLTTLNDAQAFGAILCVWTANGNPEHVKNKWDEFDISFDYYNESPLKKFGPEKPYFNILLDDRAGLGQALRCLQKAIKIMEDE